MLHQPLPIFEGGPNSKDLPFKMKKHQHRNGVLLKNLVNDDELMHWAEKICHFGSPIKGLMGIYEGHLAKAGESFHEQLKRQLKENFEQCQEAVIEQGIEKKAAEIITKPAAIKALFKLFLKLMQMHDGAIGERDNKDLRWKIKIELNQHDACTKYHADNVDIRFAMTLLGDGTVMAKQEDVNYDYYDSCDGMLPVDEDFEETSPQETEKLIKNWNKRVCLGDHPSKPGDLVIMKGGALSKRPCLHRAPYSAGAGMAPFRFLITIDRISKNQLQTFISMDFDSDEDESDVDVNHEEGSSNKRPLVDDEDQGQTKRIKKINGDA